MFRVTQGPRFRYCISEIVLFMTLIAAAFVAVSLVGQWSDVRRF
jgi:hypothetical protein